MSKTIRKKKSLQYRFTRSLFRFFNSLSSRINRVSFLLAKHLYYLDFGERDDDIYIVSFPKSGTTLMQMMLYQLTTDGNMDFKHIYDVSPWVSNEVYRKRKPRKLPSPRIIKSHDQYHEVITPIKGKFIHISRNGMDVANSLMHQNRDLKAYNYKLEDADFVTDFLNRKKNNWFDYNRAWYVNKKKLPILYLRYEDVLNDFDSAMRKVIDFCGLKINSGEFPRIRERCSFDFMKANEEKFGEIPEEEKVYDNFIRKGKIGEGKDLFSEDQKDFYIKKADFFFGDLPAKLRPRYREE